jgi:hypothetical protein
LDGGTVGRRGREIVKVDGLKFNGVQSGFGVVPDMHLFTDETTNSTFGVTEATPSKVAEWRDAHRRRWALARERAAMGKAEG